MRKARAEKKKRGSLSKFAFRAAVAVVMGSLVLSFVGGQMDIAAKQRQLDALDAQVEQQTEKNRELEQLMASGDETALVMRLAREKLGYALPNERMIVDISGQ